jgi:hypothetical protein
MNKCKPVMNNLFQNWARLSSPLMMYKILREIKSKRKDYDGSIK